MNIDWKKIVGTVAPSLATALGGPLAGVATQAISTALLGKPDAGEDELVAAVMGAGPEGLLKLKEADNLFKIEMKKLDINLVELDYKDADSARKREMVVKDQMPGAVAVTLFILFGATLWALFKLPIPPANEPVIFTMVGSLGTMCVTAAAYYHGSSRGSARKNETINSTIERFQGATK